MEYVYEEEEESLLKEINKSDDETSKDDMFVSIMNKKDFDVDELEDFL